MGINNNKQKELEKCTDIDEDGLLGKLSKEELELLENVPDDLDPPCSLPRAAFQQKHQTESSHQASDPEHLPPHVPGEGGFGMERRGRPCPSPEKKKGRETSLPEEGNVTLDPEPEGTLASASDTELYTMCSIIQSLVKKHPISRAWEKCGQR